ncbi:hypothetical protein Tdes44962_MAKER08745 [Teratosphaeria destructans]|uniref:RRM domain-containing protein n=1 Tax=Teratosphaeria destructans TaxID=418781 RepID=A0A9W7W430_9PEZI|nr:hypothetical protein Tdes44962_MAKER08745 [Teratosphaeria destructans]
MASLVRSTANRAVHLKITPRLSNIGESREIMRLFSEFGEIEHFRSLKYDANPAPNTIIVIFRDVEAAENCMRKSPVRLRMGRGPARQLEQERQEEFEQPGSMSAQHADSGSRANPFAAQQTRSLSTSSVNHERLPQPPPRQHPDFSGATPNFDLPPADSRIFQIDSNPARVQFRDQLDKSHFHGTFAIDTKSAAHQDLVHRCPSPGYSDLNWRAEDKPWLVRSKEQKMDGAYLGSGKRKSLMQIYDEVQGKARGFGDS